MIRKQLELIGYNINEATIIQSLVESGPGSASEISKRCDISRTYTYDFLYKLLTKNLIIKYIKGKTTYYAINQIDTIYHKQVEKNSIAKEVVDKLKAMQSRKSRINIDYFVGKEGYQHLYGEILEANPKEIITCINYKNFSHILDDDFETKWTKTRIKKNIKAKLLIADDKAAHELKLTDEKSYRETKAIPAGHDFDTTFILYNDNTVIFENNDGEITGLRINSADTTRTFRQMFRLVWNNIK